MNSSVGNPPGTTCSGVCACATACAQRRQAYFGRRVTSTRNCAGITSSRSDRRRGNDPPDRFLTLLPFADPCHLTAAAGTMCAGGLDHPLDPGQMRRQMTAVSPGLAGRFHALPPQRRLDLGQAGFQQGVFAGKIDGIHGTK